MICNAHNSLISTSTDCTSNRRESFLFVFNSFASLCRNVAVGWDGFVIPNNMKKHFLLIAFALLLLVGCGNTNRVDQEQPSEVCVWKNGQWTTDWMQKYVEYVRNNDIFFTDQRIIDIWNTWGLAYIDDDNTPEMILLCPGEAYGNKVLTIRKDKVIEWTSWRCNASYIPKSGLIENNDGSMGEYWDKVIRLEDGKFTEIFNHTDKIYMYHDKIDDTTGADEYYCHFKGDSTLRVGFEDNCGEYHRIKDETYYSKGNAIKFGSIDGLSTSFFEKDWTPTLPDNVSEEDYEMKLTVK